MANLDIYQLVDKNNINDNFYVLDILVRDRMKSHRYYLLDLVSKTYRRIRSIDVFIENLERVDIELRKVELFNYNLGSHGDIRSNLEVANFYNGSIDNDNNIINDSIYYLGKDNSDEEFSEKKVH